MEEREDFSDALAKMKDGYSMRRQGWNGKGLHVQLVNPGQDRDPAVHLQIGMSMKLTPLEPFFVIVQSSGSDMAIQRKANTWVPSVSDLLAEDWEEAP